MWMQIVAGVSVVFIVGSLAFFPWLQRRRQKALRRSLKLFRLQREHLEAQFLDMARLSGKPEGLQWSDCDWLSPVTFARDRKSGMLTAFVSMNVRFQAIEGSEMEGIAAVSTVREAAAVFHFYRGRWGTGGRALFNMDPYDAIERLAGQYDPIPAETLP